MTPIRRLLVSLVAVVVLGAGAADAHARLLAFKSPSGNITCVMRVDASDHFAQCELRSKRRGYSIPRRGRVFNYDVAPFDDLADQRFVLGYGKQRRLGSFTCRSRESGMRCVNRRTSHGFSLSRKRQRVF